MNLLSFKSSSFFFSMRKITWLISQLPKTRAHVDILVIKQRVGRLGPVNVNGYFNSHKQDMWKKNFRLWIVITRIMDRNKLHRSCQTMTSISKIFYRKLEKCINQSDKWAYCQNLTLIFFVLLNLRQMKKIICSIRTRIKNCTNTENLVQSSDNDVNLKKIRWKKNL